MTNEDSVESQRREFDLEEEHIKRKINYGKRGYSTNAKIQGNGGRWNANATWRTESGAGNAPT